MLHPIPELPDGTLIEKVRFPTIVRNALISSGLKTIGDIRATPDRELGKTTRIGKESLAYLRRTLGSRPNDRPPPLIQKRKLTPRL